MEESFGLRMRKQIYFWLFAFGCFLCFVWLFGDILLPFIAGMILAYALDPVADRLEAMGLSRMMSTVLILFTFLLIFILTLMIIIPILGNQVAGFLDRLPSLVAKLQEIFASSESSWLRERFGLDTSSLRENVNALMTQGAGWISSVLGQIWNSGKSIVDVISLLVVTPVVAFYILHDWDRMVERVDSWLPRDHRDTVRTIMTDINAAVAGFIRGQGTVCLILGLFYGVSLTIIGVNFGLLIGLFAGLISFIPFVGSIVGFILSVGVALVQFWPEWYFVILTGLVFAIGQFLEGNILQPKLVGDRVGLHPVWLMFALFAFGSLFGFTGMLIAVPAAAAVGIIVRFALGRYLESALYKGNQPAKKTTRRKPRAS